MSLSAARKMILLAFASTILLVCAAMVVLPGPGLIAIPFGLVLLAIEFVWARRVLRRLGDGAESWMNIVAAIGLLVVALGLGIFLLASCR